MPMTPALARSIVRIQEPSAPFDLPTKSRSIIGTLHERPDYAIIAVWIVRGITVYCAFPEDPSFSIQLSQIRIPLQIDKVTEPHKFMVVKFRRDSRRIHEGRMLCKEFI